KRRTRADVAREKGLQALADLILGQEQTDQTVEQIVEPFLCDEVPTAEEALAGARDIVAQTISDDPEVRQLTREKALKSSVLRSERKDPEEDTDPRGTYELYYEFKIKAARLRPHQILAINRGEAENVLRVHVEVLQRDWRVGIASRYRPDYGSPLAEQLTLAIEDAAQRLLLPAIARDVRRHLTERAEAHAIRIFADNLRALLSQPPLARHTVLGIDPGFRTGCKVAVLDPLGRVLDTTTIYPHEPQNQWDDALESLKRLVRQHGITLLAIGNGTASRETEQLAAELIKDLGNEGGGELHYLMVDETGASVYSASPLARTELPELDVSLRGAVSIARRVQDPLAELVKIDPRSLGVGMYQHDINQTALADALDAVVETVVNSVGVDVNTASPALLMHVSGIGPTLAERIVAHRDDLGPFASREAIREVQGIGPKTFEQAAGFLRIQGGENPLDAGAIHPESYKVAEEVLGIAGLASNTTPTTRAEALVSLLKEWPLDDLAEELDVGVPTLADIFKQLVQPGRDPRQDLPAPILRRDVLKMEDLRPHLRLKGTVRNVVDFGAFVDIGVKQDGLLHRSQIPADAALQVGDVVEVEILKVELERDRISLGWAGT
ncbi:MAG: helix-hairpin-helix domain-containing protein, partial [Anaerolineae bacterium]